MQIFSLFTLSGTPPECLDCKEEVNCSGSKGVQASSGGGAEGAGAGGIPVSNVMGGRLYLIN